MRGFFLAAACLAFLSASHGREVFKFDDYYEEGGDAFAAMDKIISLVKERGGAECAVEFSPKAYRFKRSDGFGSLFALRGVKNLSIDGKGAKISIHCYNNFCSGEFCENVRIKNFDVSMHKVAFTQGDIVDVEPDCFVFEIDKGYPRPPSNEFTFKNFPDHKWRWGSVMDRKKRAIKENFIDHVFIGRVEPRGGRRYAVYPRKDYLRHLAGIAAGDVWVMPVYKYVNKNFGADRYAVSFAASGNILVENVKISAARSAGFSAANCGGAITFRNCALTWREGSADMISSWRDGSHFKNNRVGPVLENCVFEGMLDDAVNISSAPAFATEKLGENKYKVRRFSFRPGDKIALLSGGTGKWAEGYAAANGSRGNMLCIDKPADLVLWKTISQYDIVSGNSRANSGATQIFNMEYVNKGFAVRNCRFGVQRRYSMIIRAHDGVIENNTITGGTGVIISNEFGSWFEGPLPHNIQARGNTIKSPVARVPLSVRGMFPVKVAPEYDSNILLENNKIFCDSKKYKAILVSDCKGVKLSGNKFYDFSGEELGAAEAVAERNVGK